MPLASANLSWLFTELPLLDRIDAAARAGFTGVEMLDPYEVPLRQLRARLDAAGLRQVLINSRSGRAEDGGRGLACLPGRDAAFRDLVSARWSYATALDCRPCSPDGRRAAGGSVTRHRGGGIRPTLAWAAEAAAAAGVRLVIEPINQHDIPGYYLRTQEQAAALVAAVGADRVGLQFDVSITASGAGRRDAPPRGADAARRPHASRRRSGSQ